MIMQHATHSSNVTSTAQRCERCWQIAFSATTHCLTGCAIGEVAGLAIATALGLSNLPSILIAIVLAFFFGYSLAMRPLLRAGLGLSAAIGAAVATDTISIVVMELIDNATILLIPGAMDAGLSDMLFWGSLAGALAIAFAVTWPVNYALISRGLGHASIHKYHR
jgi:hypothetical protein